MAGSYKIEDFSRASYLAAFSDYAEARHRSELVDILLQIDDSLHYAVSINALEFLDSNNHIGGLLLAYPRQLLPMFDEALAMTMKRVYDSHPGAANMSFKENVHARLSNLPLCAELTRDRVPLSMDVGRFLSFSGTVIRTTAVKMLEHEREFVCTVCKYSFTVKSDVEQYNAIEKPSSCPNEAGCSSSKFRMISDATNPSTCRDYQEIKVQEQIQKLTVGTIPRSVWVLLSDDLVDLCKPGDDVTVCGAVLRRWQPMKQGERCDLEVVIQANHVRINNEQRAAVTVTDELRQEFEAFWMEHLERPLAGRNEILSSFCPQVFGLYVVKLAVMMVLVGGVPRTDPNGTRIRGESHMLLVGDPGTGKSQFLKYASKLIPRAVMTTGIGSTNAGLTVSAVKDGGEWALEAGALVLADGGVCCIDEFNSIREHDRASIHEAMEQQTLSVAKAGLVCKLNTRTTVLAATNPKGRYDPEASLSVNIALASPLLSRFDIVLVLLDTRNEDWDRIVSSFILNQREQGPMPETNENNWTLEKLQAYICYVKTFQPVLSPESEAILSRYYQLQRMADARNAARTTIRLLEGAVRLAQAHARLCFRQVVTIQDAVAAVAVMECSMQAAALLGSVSPLHSAFPANADEEYHMQQQLILQRLGLLHFLDHPPSYADAEVTVGVPHSGRFLSQRHSRGAGAAEAGQGRSGSGSVGVGGGGGGAAAGAGEDDGGRARMRGGGGTATSDESDSRSARSGGPAFEDEVRLGEDQPRVAAIQRGESVVSDKTQHSVTASTSSSSAPLSFDSQESTRLRAQRLQALMRQEEEELEEERRMAAGQEEDEVDVRDGAESVVTMPEGEGQQQRAQHQPRQQLQSDSNVSRDGLKQQLLRGEQEEERQLLQQQHQHQQPERQQGIHVEDEEAGSFSVSKDKEEKGEGQKDDEQQVHRQFSSGDSSVRSSESPSSRRRAKAAAAAAGRARIAAAMQRVAAVAAEEAAAAAGGEGVISASVPVVKAKPRRGDVVGDARSEDGERDAAREATAPAPLVAAPALESRVPLFRPGLFSPPSSHEDELEEGGTNPAVALTTGYSGTSFRASGSGDVPLGDSVHDSDLSFAAAAAVSSALAVAQGALAVTQGAREDMDGDLCGEDNGFTGGGRAGSTCARRAGLDDLTGAANKKQAESVAAFKRGGATTPHIAPSSSQPLASSQGLLGNEGSQQLFTSPAVPPRAYHGKRQASVLGTTSNPASLGRAGESTAAQAVAVARAEPKATKSVGGVETAALAMPPAPDAAEETLLPRDHERHVRSRTAALDPPVVSTAPSASLDADLDTLFGNPISVLGDEAAVGGAAGDLVGAEHVGRSEAAPAVVSAGEMEFQQEQALYTPASASGKTAFGEGRRRKRAFEDVNE